MWLKFHASKILRQRRVGKTAQNKKKRVVCKEELKGQKAKRQMFINFITGRAGLICAAYRIRVYVCFGWFNPIGRSKNQYYHIDEMWSIFYMPKVGCVEMMFNYVPEYR